MLPAPDLRETGGLLVRTLFLESIMVPAIDPAANEWISGALASRTLGCAPSTLQRAVILGHIKIKLDPGVAPRYSKSDVERLAQQPRPKHTRRRIAIGQEARR
jgi:hypothetical protein